MDGVLEHLRTTMRDAEKLKEQALRRAGSAAPAANPTKVKLSQGNGGRCSHGRGIGGLDHGPLKGTGCPSGAMSLGGRDLFCWKESGASKRHVDIAGFSQRTLGGHQAAADAGRAQAAGAHLERDDDARGSDSLCADVSFP